MNAVKSHFFEGASAAELFPIFADVEAFPAFVPGYKNAKIIGRDGCEYRTQSVMALHVGLVTFEEALSSVTRLNHPVSIEVWSTGSRFIRSFNNVWRFRDLPGGCEVTFEMALEFAAMPVMVRPLLAGLVQMQAEAILQAFIARIGARRQAA